MRAIFGHADRDLVAAGRRAKLRTYLEGELYRIDHFPLRAGRAHLRVDPPTGTLSIRFAKSNREYKCSILDRHPSVAEHILPHQATI
jgi:hypothetical protein